MTVSTTTPYIEFTATGVLTFPFDFPVQQDTDLIVIYRDTSLVDHTLTINVDYTIALLVDRTGTVILNTSYTSGTIILYRSTPVTQETHWLNGGDLDVEQLEADLDKLVFILQDLKTQIARLPSTTISEILGILSQVQPAVDAANAAAATANAAVATVQGIITDAVNTAITSVAAAISADVTAAETAATNAAASATDAAAIVTDAIVTTIGTTTGTSPTFVLTPSPALSAYSNSIRYQVHFHEAATGTSTINISGLGAKNIRAVDSIGTKVVVKFPANYISDIMYDGTDIILLNPPKETSLSQSINLAKGANIASASTCDIWNTDGNTIHITGTTTITSFGTAPQAGASRLLILDSPITIAHSTDLKCPGAMNLVAYANDIIEVCADTTTSHRIVRHVSSGSRRATGHFFKTLTDATGATTVINGLPFKPTCVRLYAYTAGQKSAGTATRTNGQFKAYDGYIVGVGWTDCIILATSISNIQTGAVTAWSDSGFTITWTKTGTPSGNMGVVYEVEG